MPAMLRLTDVTRPVSYAALILRVASGVLFLAHGGLKLFVFTPSGTAAFFESVGVPGPIAYLTILVEVSAGLALVAGIYTRAAALAVVPVLLGAIATVHAGNGFFFNAPNGGWEFPAFWIVALIVQALLGDGAYAIGPVLSGRAAQSAAYPAE